MSIYKYNVLFQNKVFFLREEYGNGQGTFIYPNGRYSGEWENGKCHGQGTFIWSDGDTYEGEYKDGNPDGLGTYTWSDGNKYEGEWKDGEYHGQGTFSFDDGEEYVGIFKEGKPWNIIVFDSKQNIIGMWLNGLEE